MWRSRLIGLAVAAGGAGLLGFLWTQMSGRSQFLYAIGIPGALFLGAIGVTLLVFGAHLLIAPKSAARRWTPGLRNEA